MSALQAALEETIHKMARRGYGWHNRGYLPHFDGGTITQTITFRLFDSLPKTVLEE